MANLITAGGSKLLFNALGANGIFSGVSGLAMVLAAKTIAGFVGLAESHFIFELGIMLMVFGAMLVFYYRRKRIHKAIAIVITLLDLGWVIGSAALVVTMPELFSAAGIASVITIAVVVLAFFELQVYALWRTRQSELSAGPARQSA